MSYKDDIKINSNKIEEAIENQAFLFMEYAEKSAAASREKMKAENNLKTIKASLFIQAKEDWRSLWGHKPTETEIKCFIETHPDVLEAKSHLEKCDYNAQLTESIKTAFQHRKTMIANIVQLKVAGLYSTPRVQQKLKK